MKECVVETRKGQERTGIKLERIKDWNQDESQMKLKEFNKQIGMKLE